MKCKPKLRNRTAQVLAFKADQKRNRIKPRGAIRVTRPSEKRV